MNLQALFDLKERLEHAAVAGTSLLLEDFRLHRAVDALAPLAKANPVFAKISAGTAALLNAPESERGTRLLDILSLVDAVVYTQGTVNLSGTVIDLHPCSGTYVQVSYGQLQPLLTALGGTGSGRTSLIREYWRSHPEYFSDFRVLPYVVGALGDNYGELADLIGEILVKQGSGIIQLLKEYFDPEGKTEMVRRLRLIAKLAGATENDWFVSILPDSKKDVRETIIQALSLSEDNQQLLLDLCQTERGKLKEAAMRSLAAMDTEETAAFWEKEIRKKPGVVSCLKGVDSVLAANLAAGSMRAFLEKLPAGKSAYNQAELEQLTMLTSVLCGKYSADVDALWRWIADRMDEYAQIVPEKNTFSCNMSVAEHLQRTLMISILWNGCPELLSLVRQLGQNHREWFLGCAMLADMAEHSAGEIYEKYAPFIVRTGLLKRESREQCNDRIQIMQALASVRWSQELHAFTVIFPRFDALTGDSITSGRKLDAVDPRWMRLLVDPKVNQDGALYDLITIDRYRKIEPATYWLISGLVDEDDQQICEVAGSWLYQYTLDTGKLDYYFRDLIRCRWKNWKGLLSHCVRKKGELSFDMVFSILGNIPMSNMDKAAELRILNDLAKGKKVKIRFRWPEEWVERQIAILEADPNAELK